MMDGINLYGIGYYKKTVFKGSYRGLCFRIGRDEVPVTSDIPDIDMEMIGISGGSEELVEKLRVQAWKGPYILEKTDEEVFTEWFDFSDEGLSDANEWLERRSEEITI
ncbi:MAG: hypothetical protein J6P16_01420 [Eubacterium sp.]|nr:hypothetical protein [Eubacterium sp.]